MQSFDEVLNNYKSRGPATMPPATLDEIALLNTIPMELGLALTNSGRSAADYTIRGSYGAGVKPFCPWVAIFKNSISTSAQKGYYIVLLFAEDMNSCVLSLNQGYTEYMKKYSSTAIANKQIRETANEVLKHVPAPTGAKQGKINLAATGDLGKGYEIGAIFSYVYGSVGGPQAPKVTTIATPQFETQVAQLLSVIDALETLAGNTLTRFTPLFDEDFKDEIDAAIVAESAKPTRPEAPGKEPPSRTSLAGVGGKYQRSETKSANAIIDANYLCELDPSHVSFVSKKTGHNYVEAHHLIPIGQQKNPVYLDQDIGLDVRANIVSLCPNCHRILHHGLEASWKPIVNRLLLARTAQLAQKGIVVTKADLERFYRKGLEETD